MSDPSWASALSAPLFSSWISAAGDVDPALNTQVTFTQSFTLPADFGTELLDLNVYADDSATVMINGTTLFTQSMILGPHCAAEPVGCVPSSEGVIANMDVTADVHEGVNTITFQVLQEVNDTPFGVDFDGSITDPNTIPEPRSMLLLGGGLIVLGSLKTLRKRTGPLPEGNR